MAFNKITYRGNTLIDLTDSTVTPETLDNGIIAYGADGERIIGIGGSGGGSGIIKVDELPTENIDTEALYLYNGEYYKYVDNNDWVFNEIIEMPNKNFEVQFTSNGKEYAVMEVSDCFYYSIEVGDETQPAYWIDEQQWDDIEFRTITLTNAPTDTEFINWLEANATKKCWQKYILNDAPALYLPSSIDELPSDAPENAVALIQTEGTCHNLKWWLDLSNMSGLYPVAFKCCGGTYNELNFSNNSLYYNNERVYTSDGAWLRNPFADIMVCVETADAILKDWLNANSDHIASDGVSQVVIYVRDNGKWAIKGCYDA